MAVRPWQAAHGAPRLCSQVLRGVTGALDLFKHTTQSRNAQPAAHSSALVFKTLFFVSIEMRQAQSGKHQTIQKQRKESFSKLSRLDTTVAELGSVPFCL